MGEEFLDLKKSGAIMSYPGNNAKTKGVQSHTIAMDACPDGNAHPELKN
jgi:hypothetical protein